MGDRKRKIGIKAIKKALSDCAIDPNQLGWMKIVADAGDDYCLRRAIELLNTGILVDGVSLNDSLKKAIGLLGLVKARGDESI